MYSSTTTNREGKLLVDLDSGRILRADDEVTISAKVINSHPYIWHAGGGVYFAGLDAFSAARDWAVDGEVHPDLRATRYVVISDVAGEILTLQKVEDA